MLAIEKLHIATSELDGLVGVHGPEIGFNQLAGKFEVENGIEFILELIDSAKEEVEATAFRRPDKQERYLRTLSDLRTNMLQTITKWAPNTKNLLVGHATIEKIGAIADAVSEASDAESANDLDRAEFAAETARLISIVQGWEMSDYAKRSLLNGLNLIANISSAESSALSDQVIRRRIKSLVASFAIEFATIDKDFETKWETIKRWARYGFRGSSVPLALTADVSAIAGMLPKP